MKRALIIGGGTGGTLVANRLCRRLPPEELEIVVLDRDDDHVYQPGLLFVPFGIERPEKIVRSRRAQLHPGIELRLAEVDRVDAEASTVHLAEGERLDYDVLIVASGASLLYEETEGLHGPGWGESVFSFYSPEDATALREALAGFERGHLVVNLVDMPIKCPVAPLEFCFLADWFLRERGVRDQVEITYVTPLDAAFTKPVAAEQLGGMLEQRGIGLETEFATGRVDGAERKLLSWDEREVPFDLAVVIPLHGGAPFVARSPGLGDELGFVAVDVHTLQSKVAPNVFAIGDAASLPTSKAGSATHFEAETLCANVERFLVGEEPQGSYDGHVNCFIESGFHRALLIDFNYEVEPLPGRYPEAHLGPLPLLRESRLNHLGKLAFEPLYWHVLLPGREIPGLSAELSLAGKQAPNGQGGHP
ncbi:MAG TPA: FAD/NAD(P)-binding oxidoreductase [Solirubrobacterales bacterium]|nr:FAD/NAD(P)-binding oxidoreductase [Solirubrobacterales bacterium]